MAKPIMIVRIPIEIYRTLSDSERSSTYETLIRSTKEEYHVIILSDQLIESVQVEVHNVEGQSESDIKDLEDRLTILINGTNDILNYTNNIKNGE